MRSHPQSRNLPEFHYRMEAQTQRRGVGRLQTYRIVGILLLTDRGGPCRFLAGRGRTAPNLPREPRVCRVV